MKPQYSRYYTYIKPIFKNRLVRTYSSLVFSLITVTVFSLFAIKPTLSTIIALQKSIDEQQMIFNKITTKVDNLATGRKNYERIDSAIKVGLISLMPNSTSLPNLMETLSVLASVHDASISGLQIQPIDLEGPPVRISKQALIRQIDFTFNTQGSYQQMVGILNSISSLNRLIDVQSANFTKQVDGPLIMTVNAKAYFFKN